VSLSTYVGTCHEYTHSKQIPKKMVQTVGLMSRAHSPNNMSPHYAPLHHHGSQPIVPPFNPTVWCVPINSLIPPDPPHTFAHEAGGVGDCVLSWWVPGSSLTFKVVWCWSHYPFLIIHPRVMLIVGNCTIPPLVISCSQHGEGYFMFCHSRGLSSYHCLPRSPQSTTASFWAHRR